MKRGSIKHGAYTTLQLGYLRPNDLCSHSATPIPGLFVGGASLYPGGMILGGSGYLAAQVVREELESESS
jgi:phytoene dehydrogenase-like protein